MALLVDEMTGFSRFQEADSAVSFRHRPMMLKDFLRDDGSHSCTSSSLNTAACVLLFRSWSKKAAATAKISAIDRVIKLLQFGSLKSPSVLHRSFSRKLTKRTKDVSEKVKVKDILRWRSFRDVVEDNSTPLNFLASPYRSTITTTTTCSCSKSSSWCDSDFTAEELPPWGGENEGFWGKNAATLRNPKGEWLFEESEQRSPISVLDSPFREVENFFSPFHPILTNIQRTKCNPTQTIQELQLERQIDIFKGTNAAEEKAMQLLSQVKEHGKNHNVNDQVILDFFLHELSINGKLHADQFDSKMLRIAESWINGEFDESCQWEVEGKRESYVKDMEKGICWNKFTQEQEEVSKELEVKMLNELIDDFLADFLAKWNRTQDM